MSFFLIQVFFEENPVISKDVKLTDFRGQHDFENKGLLSFTCKMYFKNAYLYFQLKNVPIKSYNTLH